MTPANVSIVAQICRRLDGIPLAIELAAARVSVLTVEQIAARVDQRFRLLIGGGRVALSRQQTLAAALALPMSPVSGVHRAQALRSAAQVAWYQTDFAVAAAYQNP